MSSNARVTISGAPYLGREQKAFQLLTEVNQFYERQKKNGEIDSYETIIFDDFYSEISGITIVRGDPDKLEKIAQSEEALSIGHRAQLLFKNFRVVRGFFGENMQKRMANFAKQVELLK